jgi:hypothetical protein
VPGVGDRQAQVIGRHWATAVDKPAVEGKFLLAPGVKTARNRVVGLWRSLVSASVWGTEGREFESRQPDHFKRPVAAMPRAVCL